MKMSLYIEYPDYRADWRKSDLHKGLEEACSTLDCDVHVHHGRGDSPDAFYVFVVPRADEGTTIKSGYHYVSRSLPALTSAMYEQYAVGSEESVGTDDLIASFVDDVASRKLFRRDQLSTEEYDAIIESFGS